ncbi:MAG: hypothetical protein AAF348_11585 [Bacteroidota bacterium]
MSKTKRYAVMADFYVYAENDDDARQQTMKWRQSFDAEQDNQARVLSIHETPFAKLESRKVEL